MNPRQNGALAQWAPLAEETRPDRLIWLKLDVEVRLIENQPRNHPNRSTQSETHHGRHASDVGQCGVTAALFDRDSDRVGTCWNLSTSGFASKNTEDTTSVNYLGETSPATCETLGRPLLGNITGLQNVLREETWLTVCQKSQAGCTPVHG